MIGHNNRSTATSLIFRVVIGKVEGKDGEADLQWVTCVTLSTLEVWRCRIWCTKSEVEEDDMNWRHLVELRMSTPRKEKGKEEYLKVGLLLPTDEIKKNKIITMMRGQSPRFQYILWHKHGTTCTYYVLDLTMVPACTFFRWAIYTWNNMF